MIVILTEAGHSVGLGHVTRMRSLKDQLNADGYAARMVVQMEDDSSSAVMLMGQDEAAKRWINDIDVACSEISSCDIVVIDTYRTTEEFMKEVSDICARLIAIDDYNRILYENCVVVNPNFYGSFIEYPVGRTIEYCLG